MRWAEDRGVEGLVGEGGGSNATDILSNKVNNTQTVLLHKSSLSLYNNDRFGQEFHVPFLLKEGTDSGWYKRRSALPLPSGNSQSLHFIEGQVVGVGAWQSEKRGDWGHVVATIHSLVIDKDKGLDLLNFKT